MSSTPLLLVMMPTQLEIELEPAIDEQRRRMDGAPVRWPLA
jgi:hypothetical protein